MKIEKKKKSRKKNQPSWQFSLREKRKSKTREFVNWRDPLPKYPANDSDLNKLFLHPRTKRAIKNVRKVMREAIQRLKKIKTKKQIVPRNHSESLQLYGDCRVPGCTCNARPSASRMRFY